MLKHQLKVVEKRYDHIFFILLSNLGVNVLGFIGIVILLK